MRSNIVSKITDLAEIGVRYSIAIAVMFNITGPIVVAAALLSVEDGLQYPRFLLAALEAGIIMGGIILGAFGVAAAAAIVTKPSKKIRPWLFAILGVIPYFVVWDGYSRKMEYIKGPGLPWPWVCLWLLIGGMATALYFNRKHRRSIWIESPSNPSRAR